ncbi:MAG: glycosyltransferase family 4 protein [Algicola sp.]|nr:glycosyltransferase family 4 protein [Algicola sp.]
MATEVLKLGLVIPTFKQGGMERVMSELADHWSENDQCISLIFLVDHEPFYKINDKIQKVFWPNFKYNPNFLSKFVYKIRLFFHLRKVYKESGINTLLSFGEGYNAFIILSALGKNLKVYVSDRSNPLKKVSTSRDFFRRILYPRAEGIFAQTSLSKQELFKKTKHSNLILMPNPVKIIPREEVPKENIIVNVGRLVPEKDQITLIRIFDEIDNEGWKLEIIGEGPLRIELEKEIAERNLEEKVKLLGSKKNLSPHLSKAKIFAFTSISEGYPNALCEAMAFPLPCISFDCDAGPRDVIDDEVNGYLIEKGNTELYKEKLFKLMKDKATRDLFMANSAKLGKEQSTEVIAQKILTHLHD